MLDWGLRLVLLLALPCAAALLVFSQPLVSVLYHYGAFTDRDVQQTTLALTGYGVGLLGLVAIKVLAPGYYASQDIRTPVRIAVVVLVLTQIFNVLAGALSGSMPGWRCPSVWGLWSMPCGCWWACCAGAVTSPSPAGGALALQVLLATGLLTACCGSPRTICPGWPCAKRPGCASAGWWRFWRARPCFILVCCGPRVCGSRPSSSVEKANSDAADFFCPDPFGLLCQLGAKR